MKHSTKYLYNLNPKELTNLPYKKALQLKVESGTALLSLLMLPSYKYQRRARILAVSKALEHTKDLLKELEC